MFFLVGMGWLSVREYLGSLQVMDMTVMLSVLITSFLNLGLAFVLTKDDFAGPASASGPPLLPQHCRVLCVLRAAPMQRNDVHSPRDLHGRLLWEPGCPMVHRAAAANGPPSPSAYDLISFLQQ